MKSIPIVATASLLWLVSPVALAHGGEDHGAPAPTVSQAVAPRTSAASDEFEVVVVAEDKNLVFYLDRFATNEPVAGAKLEIDGMVQGVAVERTPGVYAINAEGILPARLPAKHPLTITIETADSADLLSATLETRPAAAATAHAHGLSEWVAWLGAGAIALVGGMLVVVRRRKQHRGAK